MIGAIIGDIVGSRFEFNPTNDYNFTLFTKECSFTDDTICTVAVADAIMRKADYGKSMHEWCNKYPFPMGGYGGRFAAWVQRRDPQPYGSFGNGAAMRVSPVTKAFDIEKEVLEQAEATAACTHNHREGIKGAQTTALAGWLARHEKDKQKIIDKCLQFSGYLINNIKLEDVQNRFDETCQGTVPVALWIIQQSESFEDAIRKAVSLGADADTLGAIVGGIAENLWGVPEEIVTQAMTFLPDEMKTVVDKFYKTFG